MTRTPLLSSYGQSRINVHERPVPTVDVEQPCVEYESGLRDADDSGLEF